MPAITAEQRLLEELRRQALELPAGSRLPSVRELSRRHRASPVTVAGAVARLAAEGLAEPRPGRGTFVAERSAAAAEPPDLAWHAVALGPATVDSGGLEGLLAGGREDTILLSSGFPGEELLPLKALAGATGEDVLAELRLTFPSVEVLRGSRELIVLAIAEKPASPP